MELMFLKGMVDKITLLLLYVHYLHIIILLFENAYNRCIEVENKLTGCIDVYLIKRKTI